MIAGNGLVPASEHPPILSDPEIISGGRDPTGAGNARVEARWDEANVGWGGLGPSIVEKRFLLSFLGFLAQVFMGSVVLRLPARGTRARQ